MTSPVDRLPKRGPGRPKGSKNKVSVSAKAFLEKLCDDPKVQAAVRRRIIKGETTGFFRAVDKLIPDPPRAVDLSVSGRMYLMPDGEDIEGLSEEPPSDGSDAA